VPSQSRAVRRSPRSVPSNHIEAEIAQKQNVQSVHAHCGDLMPNRDEDRWEYQRLHVYPRKTG
jgi:hypothetical protein